jgi:hypothetical protein
MAINSGRLVVDPVYETSRAKLQLVKVRTTTVRPPDLYVENDPEDGIVAIDQFPRFAGQLTLVRDTATDRNILYIVVDFTPTGGSRTLVWKEVRTTWYYSDSLTGEEFRSL